MCAQSDYDALLLQLYGPRPAGAPASPLPPVDPLLLSYGPALIAQRAVRPAGSVVAPPPPNPAPVVTAGRVIWAIASTASMGVSAYHGVKRNHGSIGWGVAWGAAGALFPVFTPIAALAQGYAEPLRRTT